MFQSYFITSVRGMKKNKLHAGINIAGLSVGMAVAIVIGLWIKDEVSYEKHFTQYEKIGRVLQHVTNNGEVGTWWSVPMPLAEELRKNYGDNFRHVVLSTSADYHVLSYEDKNLTQTGMFAERDFCELFTLQMIRGSRMALNDPSALIISETLAKTYFADSDPMGKVMNLNKDMTVQVAGVYRDIPDHSELRDVHFVAPWQLLDNHTPWIRNMYDPWRPNPFSLYVAIADSHSFEQVSANIKDAKLKNVNRELAKQKPEIFVHPMHKWHLYSGFSNGHQVSGNAMGESIRISRQYFMADSGFGSDMHYYHYPDDRELAHLAGGEDESREESEGGVRWTTSFGHAQFRSKANIRFVVGP